MKYRFTIEKSSVPPLPEHALGVEFDADGDTAAYRWVNDEIINKEENRPLEQGLLSKQGAFGWEPMMGWKRSGWFFTDGREEGFVDNRTAPGS